MPLLAFGFLSCCFPLFFSHCSHCAFKSCVHTLYTKCFILLLYYPLSWLLPIKLNVGLSLPSDKGQTQNNNTWGSLLFKYTWGSLQGNELDLCSLHVYCLSSIQEIVAISYCRISSWLQWSNCRNTNFASMDVSILLLPIYTWPPIVRD